MTPNHHNHIRNRFYIPELVTLEVLHMWLCLKTKNLIFSSWPMAAILDLMIAELLPRLWTSTSLIFHVYGPIDQVQVRNSPNTCLRTGLQAKDRIIYVTKKMCRKCELSNHMTISWHKHTKFYLKLHIFHVKNKINL